MVQICQSEDFSVSNSQHNGSMSGELWLLLALGAVVALWGFSVARIWWTNQRAATVELMAEVVSKQLQHETGSGWEAAERFVVTFLLSDGSRQHFTVAQAEFQMRRVGERGTLHTRGAWYRGFETAQEH